MAIYDQESIFSIDSEVCRQSAEANLSTVRRAFHSVELDDSDIQDFGFYPFTNDKVTPEVLEEIANTRYRQNGMALFVGTGGSYSFMPEVKPDLPLIVDKDIRTLRLHALLGKVILESSDTTEVIDRLATEGQAGHLDSEAMNPVIYSNVLGREMKNFGMAHWTQNFERTKEQISVCPPVFMAANLNDPALTSGLQNLHEITGKRIKFTNFTNVAHWQAFAGLNGRFAEAFPMGREAQVLFSDYQAIGDTGLHLSSVRGLEQYFRAVGASTTS